MVLVDVGVCWVVGAAASLVAIFVGLQWLEKSPRVIRYVQCIRTVDSSSQWSSV